MKLHRGHARLQAGLFDNATVTADAGFLPLDHDRAAASAGRGGPFHSARVDILLLRRRLCRRLGVCGALPQGEEAFRARQTAVTATWIRPPLRALPLSLLLL